MATIAGFPGVPKPVVLPVSTTALPENAISVASCGMATGSSVQCTRSLLTAWPQDMFPQVFPLGLYWKNRWYSPL